MLFPKNKFRPGAAFWGMALASCLAAGCKNFINLKPVGFSLLPAADNTVLDSETAVLRIGFDTDMDKPETQKALSVSCAGGGVRGDLAWRGNELCFTPLAPWLPGVRYVLNLSGTIYALDGREERVSRHVSFYVLTREGAPWGLSFTPRDGASVGVDSAGGAFVSIVFSRAMDRESAAGAFSLEGISDREIRWSGGDTVMEVHPVKSLNPWTVYRWTLGSGARGANGVPLGRELGGRFVTDADRNRPEVRETYPLLPGGPESGSRWIKTGAALTDGLGSGQALGIEFSKPMDESLVRHLRFDPPLAGRAEMWKDRAVVFIPDRDPEPERTYTLYVSAESRDTGGLKMEKDFVLSFIPDIPRLAVASLEAGGPAAGAPVPGGIYTAAVIAPEGIATVTLRFSRAVDPRARADAVLALRLEPYFPGNLRPVSFRSARWWAADTVVLQWEGLAGGTAGEKHYYRLFLPGGRGGISDGKGSYLEEDTVFFLEGVE